MRRATLIGLSAVVMCALLTDASGNVPPLLLSAIISIGTAVGMVARLFSTAVAGGGEA